MNVTNAALVPGYYLVCYNINKRFPNSLTAVVPGYYLVCYNFRFLLCSSPHAVVPGYYLVCYNTTEPTNRYLQAVVPGYYLVCYNIAIENEQGERLQFPVITWYVIILKTIPKQIESCSYRLLLGML